MRRAWQQQSQNFSAVQISLHWCNNPLQCTWGLAMVRIEEWKLNHHRQSSFERIESLRTWCPSINAFATWNSLTPTISNSESWSTLDVTQVGRKYCWTLLVLRMAPAITKLGGQWLGNQPTRTLQRLRGGYILWGHDPPEIESYSQSVCWLTLQTIHVTK